MRKNKSIDYDFIKRDYEPNDNDDDKIRDIKDAIGTLTPAEKKIWLTYVEYGTYSDTAREYKVSAPTVRKYLDGIKNKILEQLNTTNDNT